MNINNEIWKLNTNLNLHDRTYSPLPIRAINLTLTKQDNNLTECRLTFQVNWEIYHRIDTEALFNLKPELRGSLSNGDFQPEANIEIEATLQPELLSSLTENITNPEQTAAYLQNLSYDNPLLFTENWLALHVKQQQESGVTGYSTFWATIANMTPHNEKYQLNSDLTLHDRTHSPLPIHTTNFRFGDDSVESPQPRLN